VSGGQSNSSEWLFRALVRFGLDNIEALTDIANGNVNAYLKNNGKVLISANADGKLVSYMLPGDRFSNPTTELMQVAEKALWFLTSYTIEEVQKYLKNYPSNVARATFRGMAQ
jgi:superfamily I DNA and/or RNA helicase